MNDLKDLLHARLFLLDMDGTLYLGDDVFPGAVEFINTLADTGRQYIYLTNNSSRAGTDYITRLRRLGFPCEAENVFTSGMATALYLNQHYAGKPVYLVGTQAFRRELLSYGIPLVEEGAEIVVAGFDTELVYEKLDRAVHYLRRGATFIAANPGLGSPDGKASTVEHLRAATVASGVSRRQSQTATWSMSSRRRPACRTSRSAAWATGCIPTLPWP